MKPRKIESCLGEFPTNHGRQTDRAGAEQRHAPGSRWRGSGRLEAVGTLLAIQEISALHSQLSASPEHILCKGLHCLLACWAIGTRIPYILWGLSSQ